MKKEKPCGEQGWCVYVLVAKEKVIGVLSKLDAEWLMKTKNISSQEFLPTSLLRAQRGCY
jgi:hypothetical protein